MYNAIASPTINALLSQSLPIGKDSKIKMCKSMVLDHTLLFS